MKKKRVRRSKRRYMLMTPSEYEARMAQTALAGNAEWSYAVWMLRNAIEELNSAVQFSLDGEPHVGYEFEISPSCTVELQIDGPHAVGRSKKKGPWGRKQRTLGLAMKPDVFVRMVNKVVKSRDAQLRLLGRMELMRRRLVRKRLEEKWWDRPVPTRTQQT